MIDRFLNGYEMILHDVAEFTVHSLELIGILIIVIGCGIGAAVLFNMAKETFKK